MKCLLLLSPYRGYVNVTWNYMCAVLQPAAFWWHSPVISIFALFAGNKCQQHANQGCSSLSSILGHRGDSHPGEFVHKKQLQSIKFRWLSEQHIYIFLSICVESIQLWLQTLSSVQFHIYNLILNCKLHIQYCSKVWVSKIYSSVITENSALTSKK